MRRIAWLGASFCVGCAHAGAQGPSIYDNFEGPNGLIVAEGQPPPPGVPWLMTSGSLFRDNGTGWSGRPNASTGSAVFRMVSVERGFDNLHMSVTMQVDDITTTNRTPKQDYDGAHIWVRYQSEFELYAVSVDRRDGTMIIKKKCAGGTDNGGTYYDLNGYVRGAPIPYGEWQHVDVKVYDQPDGSVQINAERDGLTMTAIDSGIGCAPLHGGGVGVRGDNAELRFADISVQSV